MAPYPYKPLDLPTETRTLIIQPGKWFDRIICNMEHTPISGGEPYEALSYCWSKSMSHTLDLDMQISVGTSDDDEEEEEEEDEKQEKKEEDEKQEEKKKKKKKKEQEQEQEKEKEQKEEKEEKEENEEKEQKRENEEKEEKEEREVAIRDLLDNPRYHHVYVKWGGPMPDATILCDGVEMPIGGELFRALRYIRESDKALRIWIDALCINQNEIEERNAHVKLMGPIYQNASSTRIWLGEKIGVEDQVFEALTGLKTIFQDLKTQLEEAKNDVDERILCLSHPKWYGVQWHALAQLLDRAWFERTWIIQEVVLSNEAIVQIGEYQVPWAALQSILGQVQNIRLGDIIPNSEGMQRLAVLMMMRSDFRSGRVVPESELLDLLARLRDFKTTVASDKLYGILALIDPSIPIEVDYATTPETIFTNLAVHYIERGYLNDVLNCCGEPHQPTSLNLPSWVPDWTRQRWTKPFEPRGLNHNASGDAEPSIFVDIADGQLMVRGRLLDSVRLVDDTAVIPVVQFDAYDLQVYDTSKEPSAKLSQALKKSQARQRDAHDNMTRLAWPTQADFTWEKYHNMWRTYTCNRLKTGEIPPEDYGLSWELTMEWEFWNTKKPTEETPQRAYYRDILPLPEDMIELRHKRRVQGEGAHQQMLDTLAANRRWCYNRRFFISDAERYGWAVDGTRSGDRVAIIYGCKFPYILRDAGDGTFKIIGDCYIHGLMEGEALGEQYEEVELLIS